ncbi:MAG: histidinol dehydrogenase [Bacteroidota bacterium]
MKLIKYPKRSEWNNLLKRPVMETASLEASVSAVLKEVKENGDEAVRRFTTIFDKVVIENLEVSENEIEKAISETSSELKEAIQIAATNIQTFHKAQLQEEAIIETMPGIQCYRKKIGIEKVGLYIPGGTAPLFSTILMLGIPAKLAGCKEIILCTPPDKSGNIHPAILYAAHITGTTRIFKAGGAQAIAAMAYGTSTIPKVYKIFGPGNQYVTAAKQLVQKEGVAIDMPAGPSEVGVWADATAKPSFVAADLLSQAEHGSDSQVLLVTDNENMAKEVEQELIRQLDLLPRKEMATKAIANSKIILVKDAEEGMELMNEYAAEHLILASDNAESLAQKVVNAGSVFIGHYAPESVGDYASGTNHTLPTNGYATAYSGVSIDSFIKKITFQQLTREGLKNISTTVTTMAMAEGLQAHAEAVNVRFK